MAGLAPTSAQEVNSDVGSLLRQFVFDRSAVARFQAALAGIDLTTAPFNMTAADQNTVKSAINGLNASLQAVDMTFINQLVGLF